MTVPIIKTAGEIGSCDMMMEDPEKGHRSGIGQDDIVSVTLMPSS